MEWLLIGVFGFFGVHTVLWLYRSLRVRFAGHPKDGSDKEPH